MIYRACIVYPTRAIVWCRLASIWTNRLVVSFPFAGKTTAELTDELRRDPWARARARACTRQKTNCNNMQRRKTNINGHMEYASIAYRIIRSGIAIVCSVHSCRNIRITYYVYRAMFAHVSLRIIRKRNELLKWKTALHLQSYKAYVSSIYCVRNTYIS